MQTLAFDPGLKSRRWSTPPPIIKSGGGVFNGFVVLEELTDETGVLLWQSFRSVMLWASAPLEERSSMFLPGAMQARTSSLQTEALDAALRQPLGVLAGVLDGAAPPPAESLADACRAVSGWAEAQGKLGTALAFMQATALVLPSDSGTAYLTGRLARRRAEYARAESWFYEAISRALENRDWRFYALAFVGLGNLHIQRGNYPAGERCHTRALRIARKHGLREIQGIASHDLFVVTMGTDRVSEAEAFATDALHFYGAGHPRLPYLAYDLACFWVDHGQFARALPVFRAVLPHVRQRRERLLTLGAIGRASGVLGDRNGFDAAWNQIWTAVQEEAVPEGCAQALSALAEGAASLQDWERADQAASLALEIAEQRQETQAQFRADAVRQRVQKGRLAPASLPQEQKRSTEEASDGLVTEMVASLEHRPAVHV